MRKTILLLLVFVSSYPVFCQQDSPLQKFKYRIDHYRAINLNANGGSQFDKTELGSGTNKNSSSGGGFGISLNTIKSTDKTLLTTSGLISSGLSYNKAENSTTTNKYRNFSAVSQFTILNKWFSRKSFAELGADIFVSGYSYRNNPVSFPAYLINKQTNYAITVHTGIGKGRLETPLGRD